MKMFQVKNSRPSIQVIPLTSYKPGPGSGHSVSGRMTFKPGINLVKEPEWVALVKYLRENNKTPGTYGISLVKPSGQKNDGVELGKKDIFLKDLTPQEALEYIEVSTDLGLLTKAGKGMSTIPKHVKSAYKKQIKKLKDIAEVTGDEGTEE